MKAFQTKQNHKLKNSDSFVEYKRQNEIYHLSKNLKSNFQYNDGQNVNRFQPKRELKTRENHWKKPDVIQEFNNVDVVLGNPPIGQCNYFRAFTTNIQIPKQSKSRTEILLPHKAKKTVRLYGVKPLVLLTKTNQHPIQFMDRNVRKNVINKPQMLSNAPKSKSPSKSISRGRIDGPEIAPNMADDNEFEIYEELSMEIPLEMPGDDLENYIKFTPQKIIYKNGEDTVVTFSKHNSVEQLQDTISVIQNSEESTIPIFVNQIEDNQNFQKNSYPVNPYIPVKLSTTPVPVAINRQSPPRKYSVDEKLSVILDENSNAIQPVSVHLPILEEKQHIVQDTETVIEPRKSVIHRPEKQSMIETLPHDRLSFNAKPVVLKKGKPLPKDINKTHTISNGKQKSTHQGTKAQKHKLPLISKLKDMSVLDKDTEKRLDATFGSLFSTRDSIFVNEIDTILSSRYPINASSLSYVKKVFGILEKPELTRKDFYIVAALAEKLAKMNSEVVLAFKDVDFKDFESQLLNLKVIYNHLIQKSLFQLYAGPDGKFTYEDIHDVLGAANVTKEQSEILIKVLNGTADYQHISANVKFLDFLCFCPFFLHLHDRIIDNPLSLGSEDL
ncbi:hypothetical protein HDV02_002780 [Globomyces sp. JEL0801]|nr:hypothetical protein HDV02_002780 [Globomyces sp. JEL0801]